MLTACLFPRTYNTLPGIFLCLSTVITGRNEVVAKVIFLHLSFILFTGGEGVCLSAWIPPPRLEQTPPPPTPGADTPRSRHLREQTPPRSRHHPPPPTRLQHTVYERPVRILLECLLVYVKNSFPQLLQNNSTQLFLFLFFSMVDWTVCAWWWDEFCCVARVDQKSGYNITKLYYIHPCTALFFCNGPVTPVFHSAITIVWKLCELFLALWLLSRDDDKVMVFRCTWVYSKDDTMAHTRRPVVTS